MASAVTKHKVNHLTDTQTWILYPLAVPKTQAVFLNGTDSDFSDLS